MVKPYRKPEQAATRSNPQARVAPIWFCTRQAVDGNNMSGRDRAHQDGVQIRGVDPALLERLARGLHRQIRSGDVGIGDVALGDSGALQNPLIVGLDHLLQVVVGEHARGHVATQRA